MNIKTLKAVLLILGITSAAVGIGISIYMYNNPLAENGQFLMQLPVLLILVSLVSGIVLERLRKSER